MNDILAQAKKIVYNSPIMKYCTEENLNLAFSKIHVIENREDFQKAYGRIISKDDKIEGFNRADGSYMGPDATVHAVIHEVLHAISSKFDNQGHRIQNGIQGEEPYNFAGQINEGATDYIAAKLSGEEPRHYIRGHKLFSRLEPLMIKDTNNPDILIEVYLNNNVEYIKNFFNRYGKKGEFENLYDNFLFMDDSKMDEMFNRIEKNLNRTKRFENIINKIKNIFTKKDIKYLTEGTETIKELPNNIEKYRVDPTELNLANTQQNTENVKNIQLKKEDEGRQ